MSLIRKKGANLTHVLFLGIYHAHDAAKPQRRAWRFGIRSGRRQVAGLGRPGTPYDEGKTREKKRETEPKEVPSGPPTVWNDQLTDQTNGFSLPFRQDQGHLPHLKRPSHREESPLQDTHCVTSPRLYLSIRQSGGHKCVFVHQTYRPLSMRARPDLSSRYMIFARH